MNPQPFVIPALREWTGAQGTFMLKNNAAIVVDPAYSEQLMTAAITFRDDLQAVKGTAHCKVRIGKPAKGDLYLTLDPADTSLGKEGYLFSVKDIIDIKANTPTGVFWATRSLLQILEQDPLHQRIPAGMARDLPRFAVRGFVLDCGRKFFTMDFLRNYVKLMSYYKMNDFHVHLNDNGFKGFYNNNWDSTYSAFRLENATYPSLTAKDGHYTKKEFIDLQKLAQQYGVNIVPEIDAPAHALPFTKAVPQIGSDKYGKDHLDLDNALTYEVMDNIFKEYLQGPNPVFIGKEVHIGTDEYAKQEAEKFRAFTDHYIRLVESYGYKARLWGALTHAPGTTPVKSANVTMNLWYNGYADPKEMIRQGYDVISTPDGWLYIVPAAGYYYDYLYLDKLYHKWTPNVIGDQVFPIDHPQIKGGSFAVWNDHVGNGITEKDVHHRVFPAMQVLAQKMWDGTDTAVSYEVFAEKSKNIGEGPGLNMMGKLKGDGADSLVLHYNFNQKEFPQGVLSLKGNNSYLRTPVKGIGYGYTVSFFIKPDENNKDNAVLFSSPDAVVKLKQGTTGKLGFSREGYDYTFNYSAPAGKWTHIAITGDNKTTSLYVNGVLCDRLEQGKRLFPNNYKMAVVQTLFFPLQYIGDQHNAVKGSFDDIKVYNHVLQPESILKLSVRNMGHF
ncbi:family 20 glycosylhydrolase [Niastella vici]|uniref:family 20 glycosylhydrolase n=1 Tax=Niastella vici TaxID=1703345 RepID=UPI001C1FE882|nr:family 20 glycosylhydrolase [Niastella vici]